ncbi:hypothetical protein [Pseudanabaena sp. FACHB-2040]|uniref:hypothetical protein n=1 Tax=Pseudanabaena sp. FACHB-2040 TaxID=2692859 RepID=UPI001683AF3C|nr:hypothetical protein [Pseudanabaena sp. FACHB-2040]MBD2260603.1 hypothetical protein [Pseudanabaena sp. FACHB-2040]
MTQRQSRNRNRSKRRAICCPIHQCLLDSVSQKYPLFASKPEHLQQRGMGRKTAMLLTAERAAVPLQGEWIEAFWCSDCQETTWYHVCRRDRNYTVSPAAEGLWRQATGVVNPQGNPTVGEFTRRQSRMVGFNGIKDFRRIS